MKISLIIPCYNEAETLPHLLKRCSDLGNFHDGCIEIILVDNGSTDNTPEVLKNTLINYPHCRSIRVPNNQGYGFGILSGLKVASGDLLAWTHADMQTDPKDLLRGLGIFKREISLGKNFYIKGHRIGRPLIDVIFTVTMSIFETCLLRTPLWDINAQPNLFSREFFESWESPPNDFSLDLFVYYTARKQSLSVYRFPVSFGGRIYGVSKWNINWREKMKFILRTIKYSFELKKKLSK